MHDKLNEKRGIGRRDFWFRNFSSSSEQNKANHPSIQACTFRTSDLKINTYIIPDENLKTYATYERKRY